MPSTHHKIIARNTVDYLGDRPLPLARSDSEWPTEIRLALFG
ncbi:hypothetical protein ACUY3R_04980 [Corynebacterium sp. 23_3061]|nr:hypothetical protein [Corynebacterium kroppenstedtii]